MTDPTQQRTLQDRPATTTTLRVHVTERELSRLDRVAKAGGWWSVVVAANDVTLESARAACLLALAMEAARRRHEPG